MPRQTLMYAYNRKYKVETIKNKRQKTETVRMLYPHYLHCNRLTAKVYTYEPSIKWYYI